MSTNEIEETLNQVKDKLKEIEEMLVDINSCQSERSKTILIAAASKLTEQFKTQNIR